MPGGLGIRITICPLSIDSQTEEAIIPGLSLDPLPRGLDMAYRAVFPMPYLPWALEHSSLIAIYWSVDCSPLEQFGSFPLVKFQMTGC